MEINRWIVIKMAGLKIVIPRDNSLRNDNPTVAKYLELRAERERKKKKKGRRKIGRSGREACINIVCKFHTSSRPDPVSVRLFFSRDDSIFAGII